MNGERRGVNGADSAGLDVRERPGGVRFTVRVHPRASRTELGGVHAGALRVRVGAPPVDGAANEALIVLLAEALGVPRRAVRVVAGAIGRSKVVDVEGVDRERVERLGRSQ